MKWSKPDTKSHSLKGKLSKLCKVQSETQDIWQLQESSLILPPSILIPPSSLLNDFPLIHLYGSVTVSTQENSLLFLIYVKLKIVNAWGKKKQQQCSNNYKTTLQLAMMYIFHLQISIYKHGYIDMFQSWGILFWFHTYTLKRIF